MPILLAVGSGVITYALSVISSKQHGEKMSQVKTIILSLTVALGLGLVGMIASGFVKPFPIIFDSEDPTSYILPMFALSFFVIATVTRYVRAEMLEVLNSDYILLGRAKGVSNGKLYFKHALRNALIPAITVIAPLALALLTGTVVIERVFAIPGMGGLLLSAIEAHDVNVVLGLGVIFTVIYSLILLVVDITYGLVDPRIRIGGGE